jgi:hypothetical protein
MATRHANQHAGTYHRERAIAERRAAARSKHERARAAHLELALEHDLAQAMIWYREGTGLG